jgi:hypothetical protein
MFLAFFRFPFVSGPPLTIFPEGVCKARPGRVAKPFTPFLLTNAHGWMIPLQYVNAEELVWLFRVPDRRVRALLGARRNVGLEGSGF